MLHETIDRAKSDIRYDIEYNGYVSTINLVTDSTKRVKNLFKMIYNCIRNTRTTYESYSAYLSSIPGNKIALADFYHLWEFQFASIGIHFNCETTIVNM